MKNRSFIGAITTLLIIVFGCTLVYAWPRVILRKTNIVGGGGDTNTNWATWDETTEAGWGDSANTFICFMENPNAGGNETGVGLNLSGASLVFTQTGNVAGASGGKRNFAGDDDGMRWTTDAVDAFLSGSGNWTMLWKIDTWSAPVFDSNLCYFNSASGEGVFVRKNSAGGKARFICSDISLDLNTTDLPGVGIIYVSMWYDGTTVRGGFSSTRPTKLSDFSSGASVYKVGAVNHGTFTSRYNPVSDQTGGNWLAANVYYTIFSKTCLIDNSN